MQELVELRGANYKIYDTGERKPDGRPVLRFAAKAARQHFKDSQGWQEIDNSIVPSSGQYAYETHDANDYKVYFRQNFNSPNSVTWEMGNFRASITPAGIVLYDTATNDMHIHRLPKRSDAPEISGFNNNTISYDEVFDGINVHYFNRSDGLKELVEIYSLNDLPDPISLGLDPDATILGVMMEFTHNADAWFDPVGEIVEGRNLGVISFQKDGKFAGSIPELTGFSGMALPGRPGHKDDAVQNKMTKRLKIQGNKTYLIHGVAYRELLLAGIPYTIDDSFQASVANSGDDGRYQEYGEPGCSPSFLQNTTSSILFQHYYEVSKEDYFASWVFWYDNVTIDQGDTIDDAYVVVYGWGATYDDITAYARAAAADDPAAPTVSSLPEHDFSGTSAIVTGLLAGSTFSLSNEPLTTHSFTAVVQELVNRGGWANGNAMYFWFSPFMKCDCSGYGTRSIVCVSRFFSSTYAPELNITYTPASVTTGPVQQCYHHYHHNLKQ